MKKRTHYKDASMRSLNLAFKAMLISLTMLALSSCGGDGSATNEVRASSKCPPAPKSGLSAIERAGGLENFEKYSKWQMEIPPKSCAGKLAEFVPDLPEGYGLPPSFKPPIMNDTQVYLKYVKVPEANSAQDLETIGYGQQPQFEFEILQLSQEKADTFKDWFKENRSSYSEYKVEDRVFYALGGGGWYLPGTKIIGGIGVILDNNVLIKFTMPNIYSDKSVPEPIAKMFHEIAKKNGY